MKLVLKIWFFMSFIFCQQLPSKAEYFLSNKKNFDKLDEKISTQIKKELNKIEIKIKKELKISYKIENTQEQVSERRITGYEFPNNRAQDAYVSALLSMNNPTQYESDYLKRQFQVPVYRTVIISPRKETIGNQTISFNRHTFSARPKWEDVVEFYGGYAELGTKNINKADWQNGEFDINAKLTAIELINETECLAIVDISGNLKLNKVPKSNYKYKGSYAVEDFGIYDIYRERLPGVVFTFKDKKYLPIRYDGGGSNKFTKPINSFVDVDTDLLNKYSSSIDMMFDDLVTWDIFNNIDDIKDKKREIVEHRAEKEARKKRQNEMKEEAERKRLRVDKLNSISLYIIGRSVDQKGVEISYNGSEYIGDDYELILESDAFIGMGMYGIGLSKIKYNKITDINISYFYDESKTPTEFVRFGMNISMGYDLSMGYLPIRPFIGLGAQYHLYRLHDGNYYRDADFNSDESILGLYYFCELVKRNDSRIYFGLSICKGFDSVQKQESFSIKIGLNF